MRAIEIRTIEHEHQRFNTVGDWIYVYGMPTRITVSRLPHPDFEFIVAVRELVDMYLCSQRVLTEKVVGPYGKADLVEELLINILGVDPNDYQTAVGAVCGRGG